MQVKKIKTHESWTHLFMELLYTEFDFDSNQYVEVSEMRNGIMTDVSKHKLTDVFLNVIWEIASNSIPHDLVSEIRKSFHRDSVRDKNNINYLMELIDKYEKVSLPIHHISKYKSKN